MQTTIKVHTITLEVDNDWHEAIAQATSPEYFFGAEVCNWLETSKDYDKVIYTCDICETLIDEGQFGNNSASPDYCIDCYACSQCGESADDDTLIIVDGDLLCPKCVEEENEV